MNVIFFQRTCIGMSCVLQLRLRGVQKSVRCALDQSRANLFLAMFPSIDCAVLVQKVCVCVGPENWLALHSASAVRRLTSFLTPPPPLSPGCEPEPHDADPLHRGHRLREGEGEQGDHQEPRQAEEGQAARQAGPRGEVRCIFIPH